MSSPSNHFGALVRRLLHLADRMERSPSSTSLSWDYAEAQALVWALEELHAQASENRRSAIDNAIKLFNIAARHVPQRGQSCVSAPHPSDLRRPPFRLEASMIPRPTSRQIHVLRALREWIATHGKSPTLQELTTACGLRSIRSTAEHVFALRRKGLVGYGPAPTREGKPGRPAKPLALTTKGEETEASWVEPAAPLRGPRATP